MDQANYITIVHADAQEWNQSDHTMNCQMT